jgi:predicted ATPase/class 3 adenylate cyclase
MTAATYPTGTVTFLFTDIEGSTRLWEAEPEAMHVALAAHDAIVRAAIEAHGGIVFKTVGDAFCAAFARPEEALLAAVGAQRALSGHAWPEAIGPLRARVGIHTGTAVESGGDYFGPTVNRVARLMSLGAGEQILVSSASASLLRDALPADTVLRDLGTHRLKDLSQPENTYQVVAAGIRSDFPPLSSLDARPNNLPFQISSFVGRERELREVRDALSQRRLVTVVGPGGIGKTRLALQVAADAIGDVKDGAWIVRLSPLRAPELIAQATADVLHVREEPQSPLGETLARALAGREMLIVFDSAEHLVAGTAAFVMMLLNRCARLKVLVTSREPLHLTGERVVRVRALDSAAELFLDRALEVAPGLAVDAAATEAIADICRRLEGIPLAIELAAARAATLPLAQLASRLSTRLDVLVSRDSTREERHRTLRATIAWSYDLLDSAEAAAFRALGVFRGSFEIAAICAVTGGAEDESLDIVEALIGKSLVSLDPAAPGARYAILDIVREYLIELLGESGELEPLRALHFSHYDRFTSSRTTDTPRDEITWLNAIAADVGNLRAALDWGLRERPSEAAGLVCTLARYWKIRGHITEGRAWFRRFLAEPRVAGAARAGVLRRAATFATEQDDYDEARALSTECRTLYEGLNDVGGVAEAVHNLAVVEQRSGRVDLAAAHYATALAKFREARHDYGECIALMNMVLLAFSREDLDDAKRWIGEAEVAAGRTDNPNLRAHISGFYGELALRTGDLGAAAESLRDAIEVKRALGNRYDVADLENTLAIVRVRQGRVDDALACARETLRTALELDVSSLVIFGFEAFCEIAAYEQRYDDAALYYGLAQRLRRARSYQPSARKMDEIELALRAQLGERFEAILASCDGADWRKTAAELGKL